MDKDNQDDNKKMPATPVGHESHEAHLCLRCGWPFPTRPTAKHRRSHKKVCGTIEGYKLVGSGSVSEDHTVGVNASDDDNLSDDDPETPSPKLTEKSNDGRDSVGIGERSNRSEDEVFSDAVTEFPEGVFTPGIEEHPNNVKVTATYVEKSLEKNFTMFHSFKDTAVADIIKPSSNSTDSSQMQNPEVPENATALPQSNLESQVHASSSTEESAVILTDDKSRLVCDFQPVEPETSMHVSQENKVMNAGDDVRDGLMTYVGQETDAKGNDVINSESNVAPFSLIEYQGQISKAQSKCQEMEKTSDPMSAAEVLSKEEHGTDMASKMSSGDPMPRLESVKLSGASDTAQNKVGAEQGLDLAISNSMEDFSVKGEGNENVYELSVPAGIPVVDHAETMLENFKDYKGVKLHQPVTCDSAEIITEKKVDVEDPVSMEDLASVQMMQLNEVGKVSASDMQAVEDNHVVVGNPSTEVKSDNSNVKFTSIEGSDDFGAPSAAVTIGMEQSNPVSSVEKQHFDVSDDSLHVCVQETAAMVSHNVNPMVASLDTTVIGLYDAENHKNLVTEMCETGNDKKERVIEVDSAKNMITNSDAATNLPEFQVNPAIILRESDDAGDLEKGKIEKCVAVGVESKEETSVEKLLLGTKSAFESDCNLHESQAIDGDVKDVSVMKLPKTKLTNINGVSVTPDISKHLEVKDNDQALGEFNTEHSRNVDSLERTSEDHATKASLLLPSDTETSLLHSVDDNYVREHSTGHSGIDLSSQGQNNGNNFVKHQLGASAIDVSVDTSSQTDSLEGNWGSVSVLSTQSDIPAVVDAETLASAEKLNSKKLEYATERQRSEKSDVYEAPSFMTLVEPGGGNDQKAATSDIETVQNLEQKQASSQAGWFPSLTHVVNESQGRNKNEEIIAKVTNWSTGKQHAPPKNLLGEVNLESKPKSPNPRENKAPPVNKKDDKVAKENNALVTTVGSMLGPEVPTAEFANTDTRKEVNSPASYSANIKREKRKVKGRPYWAQFVCCSSVN